MAAVRFFKLLIMMHCILIPVVKNQLFQGTLLGVGVSQKRVLCVRAGVNSVFAIQFNSNSDNSNSNSIPNPVQNP